MISFKKILATMAIDDKDKNIATYIDFFGSKLATEEVCNFHAFVVNSLYKDLNSHDEKEGDELLRLIENQMAKDAKEYYQHIPKVSYQVAVGKLNEGLLHTLKKSNADLIALGKSEDGDSIAAKNVLRYLPSNALIIPAATTTTLSHILVAVDLSEHSAKLLKAALAIQKKVGDTVKITCFHSFEPPSLPYYKTLRTEKVFKAGYTDRFKIALAKFIKEQAGADAAKIEGVIAEEIIERPSHYILDYMKEHEVDFLIMGTHSHTGFDAFLGSTVERVLVRNDEVPMLVIK